MVKPTDPIERVGSLVSQDLVDALRAVFPPPKVVPGVKLDEVMFASGGQALLDYMQGCLDYVNSESEDLPDVLHGQT